MNTKTHVLQIALSDYAHTAPLFNGEIEIPGLSLQQVRLPLSQIFKRFLREAPWEVAEISMGKYAALRAQGACDFIPLPVFPYRVFRHACFYVRADSELTPARLRGKRIGLSDWALTAAIYARALLMHDYGIGLDEVKWVQAGLETPSGTLPKVAKIAGIDLTRHEDRALLTMLRDGDIDALIAPHAPASGATFMKRLFPDYPRQEMAYWKTTGIFPIMHAVAMRGDVEREHPGTAAQLLKGFEAAKQRCIDRLLDPGETPIPLPFLSMHLARLQTEMGADFWPYGIERNRKTLDAFLAFAHEQGVCEKRLTVESVFPAIA